MELAIRGARDFDAFYADRCLTPEPIAADHLIVLSFNGKGLAMLHEHLRKATRLKAETRTDIKEPPRPKHVWGRTMGRVTLGTSVSLHRPTARRPSIRYTDPGPLPA